MRVLVLVNDDAAAAEGADRAAVEDVLATAAAIESELRALGHHAACVRAPHDLAELVSLLTQAAPDLVFNQVESWRGASRHESSVAALLAMLRLEHTGSTAEVLALVRDKAHTKAVLAAQGLRVSPSVRAWTGAEDFSSLRLPVIVKPASEDASQGLSRASVVSDEAAIRGRVLELVARYDGGALVEEFLPGREFNVSLLEVDGALVTLPIREIDFRNFPGPHALLTYASKWDPSSEEYEATPVRLASDLDKVLSARLEQDARRAFRALGLRDYGRVDFRLDAAGVPHVLEVNANPDFGPTAGLASAAAAHGLDYRELVRAVVVQAARRLPLAPASTSKPKSGRPPSAVEFRAIASHHRDPLARILAATGAFTAEEIDVALELIDLGIAGKDTYQFLVAERAGQAVGYACFGPTPLTDGTFDLYWIAVDPALQGSGVGQTLLRAAEAAIRSQGGRKLLIETASKPEYAPTRAFYERAGYHVIARIGDFYRVGDDKLIYERTRAP